MGVTVLDSPQAAEAAAAALAMVGASPRDAQDAALEARRISRTQQDRAAESVAGRALGLARKELGDLVGARAALRDAVRVADQGRPRRGGCGGADEPRLRPAGQRPRHGRPR